MPLPAQEPVHSTDLVCFLSRPDAYPRPTATVTVLETHISWVFLTDQYVYKLKKPVRFAFLDYSTADLRQAACAEEVRLNSRLAPGIYLGVVPITRGADGQLHLGGEGTAVDYCVEMKRLPAERLLDGMIRRGEASSQDMAALLDVLLSFYARAPRGPEIDQHATRSAIEKDVRGNLEVLGAAQHGLPLALFQRVRASQLQFLNLSPAIFDERIQAGRIREGHGDLRPEHVCLLQPPVVFDCVEFALSLRAADVLNELAFLAMECDFLGAPELGQALMEGYQTRSPDAVPEALVSFYKSYRACIRAKVELLRAEQQSCEAAAHSRQRAHRYLQLAGFYATDFARPQLVVMVGACGSGKSAVATALAQTLGLEILRSDALRHALVGRRDPEAPFQQGIYSPARTQQTYEELFRRASVLLHEAVSVVLDGSFLDPQHRQQARALAHECGAAIHILWCRCPREVALARIADRLRRQEDISDARPEFYDLQEKELGSAEDLLRADVLSLNTAVPTASVVVAVLERLGGWR
jgi:aminoglycoside phosphotransferase family enzyme/predicted kinase